MERLRRRKPAAPACMHDAAQIKNSTSANLLPLHSAGFTVVRWHCDSSGPAWATRAVEASAADLAPAGS
jgi:hypothetical protein